MKILTIKGYDIWQCKDGYYGIVKTGESEPYCAYSYLWVVLKQKDI